MSWGASDDPAVRRSLERTGGSGRSASGVGCILAVAAASPNSKSRPPNGPPPLRLGPDRSLQLAPDIVDGGPLQPRNVHLRDTEPPRHLALGQLGISQMHVSRLQ